MDSYLGLIEMYVVLAFAIGWGIIELVCLRLDKKRKQFEDGSPTEKS